MRLILGGGILMVILTFIVIFFGFKRTAELNVETHGQQLMLQPKTTDFDLTVGLNIMGPGMEPADYSAGYSDGLTATLTKIDRLPCTTPGCDPLSGDLRGTLQLTGGALGSRQVTAALTPGNAQWLDDEYEVRLLDIQRDNMTFSISKRSHVATP